jgi:hypothetical protein
VRRSKSTDIEYCRDLRKGSAVAKCSPLSRNPKNNCFVRNHTRKTDCKDDQICES